MPQRTLTHDHSGAVTLDLHVPHGRVQVLVDDGDRAEITLTTPDGPDTAGVDNTATSSEHGRWTVRVPAEGGNRDVTIVNQGCHTRITGNVIGAGMIVTGATMHITQNGRNTIIHGAGAVVSGGDGPLVQARLPRGSSLDVSTQTASVETAGHPLASVRARSLSGDLRFGAVGDLAAESTSGDVTAGEIGTATVHTVSGDIEITGGTGTADLHSVSGDVRANTATGDVRAASTSGDVTIIHR